MKKTSKFIFTVLFSFLFAFSCLGQDSSDDDMQEPEDTLQQEEVMPGDAMPNSGSSGVGEVGDDGMEMQEGMESEETASFHQVVKEKFIEGGWKFMSFVLIALIVGLAISLERIIFLNLATTNTKKLVDNIDQAIQKDGVDSALKISKASRGPVASIFTQGLMRYNEGIDAVEKSVIGYGSVEMGKLERGLTWISLCISLAPMLGFMGTVIGMIDAFDAIEAAGDISPALVARGIKVALLTTVGGLIVAIILQLFYNYCVSKIDAIVNQMEESSISLIDVLVKNKKDVLDTNKK